MQLPREANLKRTRTGGNVEVRAGDGSIGCAERPPYDAISVPAVAPEIPASLLARLRDPGRLVIPVGPRDDRELRVVTKYAGRIHYRMATLCRCVPLRGGEGWH